MVTIASLSARSLKTCRVFSSTETGAFGTERVLNRHLDVVKRHVRRTGDWRVGRLDGLGLDAFLARNEDGSQTAIRLATNGEATESHIRLDSPKIEQMLRTSRRSGRL